MGDEGWGEGMEHGGGILTQENPESSEQVIYSLCLVKSPVASLPYSLLLAHEKTIV